MSARGRAVTPEALGHLRRPSFLGVLTKASLALFGISDISPKFLTHAARGGLETALSSPWTLVVAASVIALLATARSLQLGPRLTVTV